MGKDGIQHKETWKVFGSNEILQDKNLIEYYKLHQFDVKLKNELLGNFTSEGKYLLPDEIKKMLVGVKKLITYSGEDSYFAESEIKTSSLRFAVKYWSVKDLGIANLYFIENIDGEDIQTFVAQYASEKNESFLVKVKSVFNLVSEASELEDKYLKEIEEQYNFLKVKKTERDFVVELQSEYYLYEIFQILKKEGGEKSRKIAEQIELEIDEKKQLTNKEGLYTAARLKMDKLIIAAGGFNALMQEIPALPKIVQNYIKPVRDYDDISKKLDAMELPSDEAPSNKSGDKKSNAKKGGAKNGGSKKKSGGSAKKSGSNKSGGKADKGEEAAKDLLLGSDIVRNWRNIRNIDKGDKSETIVPQQVLKNANGINNEQNQSILKIAVPAKKQRVGGIGILATGIRGELNKIPVDMKVEKKDVMASNNEGIKSAIDLFGGLVGASEKEIKNADILVADNYVTKKIESSDADVKTVYSHTEAYHIRDGEVKELISYDEKVVVSETFSEKGSVAKIDL